MNKRTKAYLVLTLVSLLWGIASPVIKFTLEYIPPYSFLFWRFLMTSLIFLPIFLYFVKKYPLRIKDWPLLILLGLLGTSLNLILLFVGYEKTTSMDGVLISATAPIFITLGGAFFLKENITKIEKIGLAIAVFGSLITVSQPIFEGNLFKGNLTGNILIFLSVLSWTAYTLIAKRKAVAYHPVVATAISFFLGLLVVFPFFWFERMSLRKIVCPLSSFESPSQVDSNPAFCYKEKPALFKFDYDSKALPGIIYMSVFSSVIAFTLFLIGVRLIEASEATLFAYLQPIFAAPFALIWLKEKITLPFLIGAFFIGLGVFLAEKS